MEREAKLRRPPAAAAGGGAAQRGGADLLRHAQAVLKRHRPLPTGAFPSLDPRGRRLVAEKLQSQSVGDGDCAAAHEREKGNIGDKGAIGLDQTAESGQIDFSLTTPNTMGTVTESVVSQNVGVNLRNRIASETCNQSEFDNQSVLSHPLSSISGDNKRSTLYSADNVLITRSPSMLDNGSCCTQGGQFDSSNAKKMDLCAQQDFESSAACNVGSLPENIHQFMLNPVAQTSLSGLSFAATTSLQSVPAPLLNLTTHSTRSDVGVETIDEFKLQLQPVTQGDSFMQNGPPYSGSIGVSHPTAVSTQMSGSAPQISVGSEDQNLLNRQDNKIKNHGGLKAVHFSDEPTNGERLHPAKPCETIQASSVAQKIMLSTNVKDPFDVIKSEKDTSSKSSSGSRKKGYNSDLFVKVNGKLYQKLGKIGSGGSSEVYKVISSNCTIYALKMIKLKGRDYSTAYGFCQEIKYLNKLKGNRNIIQLIDYEVTNRTLLEHSSNDSMTTWNGNIKDEGHVYMVLEYGEIDLAHMLSQKWKEMNNSFQKIDENWLRFYWQQILSAVDTIHEERIVHSDLKPANFLLVKGSLKLIDFGIAKAIMSDTTNIQRDAQMGTLNYMSPEAYMWNEEDAGGSTIKCGRPSDIWSLGCILYQMVYGRTPFSEYKNFWAKFKAITDRNHQIKYGPVPNPWLLDLMKKCLAWDRDQRWRIPQLLKHPFLVPTAPPQLSPSRYEHCKLLVQMAEAYRDDTQVSNLCNQLHDIIATVDEDKTCKTSLY